MNAKSRASSQPGAADGVLSHSPMRREQIIYSLIPVRVPGAGELRGLGGCGGGGSPRPLSPSRRPLPAPAGSRRAHTHFLTISEHTLAARPPAAPQLLSPARPGLRGAGARERSCRPDAQPRNAGRRCRRAGAEGGVGRARRPGAGGLQKRGEEREK